MGEVVLAYVEATPGQLPLFSALGTLAHARVNQAAGARGSLPTRSETMSLSWDAERQQALDRQGGAGWGGWSSVALRGRPRVSSTGRDAHGSKQQTVALARSRGRHRDDRGDSRRRRVGPCADRSARGRAALSDASRDVPRAVPVGSRAVRAVTVRGGTQASARAPGRGRRCPGWSAERSAPEHDSWPLHGAADAHAGPLAQRHARKRLRSGWVATWPKCGPAKGISGPQLGSFGCVPPTASPTRERRRKNARLAMSRASLESVLPGPTAQA